MNGRILAYVQQQLVRTLQPGDVVVMDNLAAQKVAGVREALKRSALESPIFRLSPHLSSIVTFSSPPENRNGAR
jgi:hypothetical protein